MAARIETHVRAGNASIAPVPAQPVIPAAPDADTTARAAAEREVKRRDLEERIGRWKQIAEAGGIENWIEAQIKAKGLNQDHVDPSKLNDKERGAYKDKKKEEALERKALGRAAWRAYHAVHIVHLGSGVHWDEYRDPDRFDTAEREERARANGLPDLKGPEDLAAALGMTVSRLRWLTYHREVDTGSHYRRWSIPKRNGTSRTITAPKKDLKAAQRWALRNVFEKLPVHGSAHGFLPARSIATNAVVHAGADVIVKVDVKEFFPTITWRRVKGLLRRAGMREQIATLLALLCSEAPRDVVTFRGKTLHVATGARALPQGAPTSPAISNAITLHMDRRMSGLGKKFGFRYTRYADDLIFSCDEKKGGPRAPVGALLHGIAEILSAEGFRLNQDKTRVLRGGTRQRVTGLVVNRPPKPDVKGRKGKASAAAAPGHAPPAARVPRDVIRRLRAAIHNREHGKPGKEGETMSQLRGMAAFIHMTDPARGAAFLQKIDALERRGAQPAKPA